MTTKKSVQLYESTFDCVNLYKGDSNIATFIDTAVKYYVQHIDDQSELKKINETLNEIKEAVRTNLGLNCEVLRQEGILDGNAVITVKKS